MVDGDTIDVEGGVRIRLIGIDTPERGQCGFDVATATMSRLVAGKRVVLLPGARSDSDRYGRLLRYVEVDGVDANLAMIAAGMAVARYDGLDGYGRHPRQDAYRATDAATPPAFNCGAPAPLPLLGGGGSTGGGGEVYFRNCTEAWSMGAAPILRGAPGYRPALDRDGDGVACERRP